MKHNSFLNSTKSKLKRFTKISAFLTFPLVLGTGMQVSGQGTIISQTGAFSGNGYDRSTVLDNMFAVSWTSTVSFAGVSISIPVYSGLNSPGEAYLTQSIGSGTTIANEIASAIFVFPNISSSSPLYTTVLSGLNLGPGTYYLIIRETDFNGRGGAIWHGTSGNVWNRYPNGITPNGQYQYYGSTLPIYAPAAAFSTDQYTLDYNISFTAVPEPSGLDLILLAAGCAVLCKKSMYNGVRDIDF